ncbi:MAG: hypothetical protein V1685_05005 [Parcubacteria group bacterium]
MMTRISLVGFVAVMMLSSPPLSAGQANSASTTAQTPVVCPSGCVPTTPVVAKPAAKTIAKKVETLTPIVPTPINKIDIRIEVPPQAAPQPSMSPETMMVMMKMMMQPPSSNDTTTNAMLDLIRQNTEVQKQLLVEARSQSASARVANKWLALSGITNSVSAVTGVMTVQRLGTLNQSMKKQADTVKTAVDVANAHPLQVLQSVGAVTQTQTGASANAQGGQGGTGGSGGGGGSANVTATSSSSSSTNAGAGSGSPSISVNADGGEANASNKNDVDANGGNSSSKSNAEGGDSSSKSNSNQSTKVDQDQKQGQEQVADATADAKAKAGANASNINVNKPAVEPTKAPPKDDGHNGHGGKK